MPDAPFEIGYWLSSEEHGPRALVDHATLAEQAGFRHVMISDHFHPWLEAQGHAPFVWGVIGAIAQATDELHVATGVTAPILRMHPAVVAHASATAAVQCEGRFALGVGTGERLNEHVVGGKWPTSTVRREMLREAVEIIRRLLGGDVVSTRGDWFEVDHARLFTRPETPPPIWVAASGRRSARLAGEVGDGLIGTSPDAALVQTYETVAGHGTPRVGQLHVCWAESDFEARRAIGKWWPNGALTGRLVTELERPEDVAAACAPIDDDAAAEAVVHGSDPEVFAEAALRFAAAGFTRVYVHQIGPERDAFLWFWNKHVAPLIA